MLNLLDADKKLIEDFFEGIGEKKFRAAQTAAWLYRGAANFSEMTDLSKSLRLKPRQRDRLQQAGSKNSIREDQATEAQRNFCLVLRMATL